MAIDIFNIKPNVVTRDLKGKSFFFYGRKKVGKTTIASKFLKSIIIAFEKGYNFIPGIIAQPVSKWSEALEVKKALLKDAEKAEKEGRDTVYQTVIVDTGDIAYDLCEQYIVDKEGVNYLDETEKMRGYKATTREFDKYLQEIVKAGYTLIVISHSTTKQIKENGEKYERTIPTITDRGMQVVSRLVDVIGFCDIETDEETQENHHVLIMRGSKELEAGSRNPYLPDKIPLSYDALLKAMGEATDKIEANGGEVADIGENPYKDQSPKVDFEEIRDQIKTYAKVLIKSDKRSEYERITAEYIGHNKNVKDCTEQQIDQLVLILQDLKDYFEENNIELE